MLEVRNAGVKPCFVGDGSTLEASLFYAGKPAFKFGPMSETSTFAFKLDSPEYDVRVWAKWQQDNGMGYVRCYPEQGYGWVDTAPEGRLYPFNQVLPLVFDLDRLNVDYWNNFRQIGEVLQAHGIVIHLQLVQVCYFKLWEDRERRWQHNFWNPANNINDWCAKLKPEFPFSDLNGKIQAHWRRYVTAILDAIGDLDNVLLDIGNELHGEQKWVDWNLDIIESWEKEHARKILKGLDCTHMPSPSNVLGDSRFDVIMIHGQFVDLAHLLRRLYGKPVVSIISRDSMYLGIGEGVREKFDSKAFNGHRFRRFHYRCLMNKVQGVGDYGKAMGGREPICWMGKNTETVKVDSECAESFARDAKILSDFFTNIGDYSALNRNALCIVEMPAGTTTYCLASSDEAIVYMETGINMYTDGREFPAARLVLDRTASSVFPRSATKATIINPQTGVREATDLRWVSEALCEVPLPAFRHDLLVHIQ